VPPRFQGSSSPIVTSFSPRFQTNYTPQVSAPGGVNSPDQQQRDDVIPPAYPRPLASPNPFSKSNSSLPLRNQSVPRGPTPPLTVNHPGIRTINAAAFKRPVQRHPGSVDSEMGKVLPSTPFPMRDVSSSPGALAVQGSEVGGGQQPQPQQPQQQPPYRKRVADIEDDYDYISAYVDHSGPPSPQRMSFGHGLK